MMIGSGTRAFFIVTVIVSSAVPALAARRISVDQLHSMLVEQKQASRKDDETARKIGNVELIERLSPYRLTQFCSELKLGPKTVLALTLLGDSSAFLYPPPDDLVSMSLPDSDAQRTMLRAAFEYVANNIHRLPDFLARRTTRSFDDSPIAQFDFGTSPFRGGPHFVRTIVQEITFRNGKEELNDSPDARRSKQDHAPAPKGLTSWGEFGTLQAIILADSSKGELKWSHWERNATGIAAVFDFRVPQIASNYLVDYCCVRSSDGPDLDHPYIQSQGIANSYKGTPAYHGTLSLDPQTGAILRITLQAELKKSDPISRNDVAVQFGTVQIAGRSYICPIQSVAVTTTLMGSEVTSAEWEVIRVNDAIFTDYHKFGSTATILPGFPETK